MAVPVRGVHPAHLRDIPAALDDLVRRPRNRPAGRPARRHRAVAALRGGLWAVPGLGRGPLLTFIGKGDKPARVPSTAACLTCGSRGRRRTQRTTAAHPHGRRHGPPIRPPLRRPYRPGRSHRTSHRPAAPAPPHPPRDHPGQLRHQRRCARTTCLTPGRGLPRRLDRLTAQGTPPGAPSPSRGPQGRAWAPAFGPGWPDRPEC